VRRLEGLFGSIRIAARLVVVSEFEDQMGVVLRLTIEKYEMNVSESWLICV